jgi:hypothetical protein
MQCKDLERTTSFACVCFCDIVPSNRSRAPPSKHVAVVSHDSVHCIQLHIHTVVSVRVFLARLGLEAGALAWLEAALAL